MDKFFLKSHFCRSWFISIIFSLWYQCKRHVGGSKLLIIRDEVIIKSRVEKIVRKRRDDMFSSETVQFISERITLNFSVIFEFECLFFLLILIYKMTKIILRIFFRMELVERYNASVRFLATQSGLTRWQHIPDEIENE